MKRGRVTKNGEDYRNIMVCEFCGDLFLAVRSDAKYCPFPRTCRQKMRRRRLKYERKRTREICARHGITPPPSPWEKVKERLVV